MIGSFRKQKGCQAAVDVPERQGFDQRGAVEARSMAKLADLGFRFSIDKVTDLDSPGDDAQEVDLTEIEIDMSSNR